MASVQNREQSRGLIGESGIFELGEPLPAGHELDPDSGAGPAGPALGQAGLELQRANDALQTANVELRTKLEQLRVTAHDLEQVIDGLELGIVLLDGDLVLRHFNSMAAHFLGLEEQDVGGSISATCRGLGSRLAEWASEVLRSGKRIRRTFQSAIGEPLSLQVRHTRVDGELRVILVFAEALESL